VYKQGLTGRITIGNMKMMDCLLNLLQRLGIILILPCFQILTAGQDQSPLFRSVKERPEPISADVKGNLPSWLNGTLIRNGPGRFEYGNTSYNHWFDGQALLHRFHIQDGQVTYSNKFVRSECYADSLKHGKANHLEFGTFIPPDPCQSIFARFFSRYFGKEVPMDNTNVNVYMMKDKKYATSESNFIFEIDSETLDILKKVDFTKEFPGGVTINTATAHPHRTPDGSVINLSVSYGLKSTYKIIQIPPSSGNASQNPLEGGKVLSTIKPKGGIGYVHSFGLTDNYIVITEGPLIIDIWRVLTHRIFATSPAKWLYWEPNQPTRFYVIDRQNGNQVGVFTADPFLVFHHINAFEKDGNIYLDICCYRNDSVINQIYLQNLRSPVQPGHKKFDIPEVRRYELPLGELEGVGEEIPLFKGGDGRDYTLLYVGMELPRINYAEHNGKPYRFAYGLGNSEQLLLEKLVKLNVETKEFSLWEESGSFVSEPVFVKAPDGEAEDDGVVLSCIININNQTTSLLVLDAKEFKELGRAVVQGITPATFHGSFQ